MGRHTDFTPELASTICERIASGESLRTICKEDEFPTKTTVFKWLSFNKEFADQYARAREAQAEGYAEEIVEISDDGSNDFMEVFDQKGNSRIVPDLENINRARLRVDARKWVASKLLAKKYGDKLQHTGSDGEGPVQFTVTRAGSKEK